MAYFYKFISIFLVMVLAGTVAAQEEPLFTNLSDGQTVTGEFEGDISARLYSFDASAGDVVTISMTQASEALDPYLVLLGAAGEVLTTDDDSGEVLYSARIQEFEIPADGDYLVLATTFEAIRGVFESLRQPLSYELSISGIRTPTSGDTETVTLSANALEQGANLQLVIGSEEPIYFLQFSGTEGETVSIDMQSEDFDTLLYLFGPDGSRVSTNDDSDDSTNSRIENFQLPQDGTYLVFATSYDFTFAADEDWEGGGEFTLSMQ